MFIIHKLQTTQVGPEMNIYGYNYDGVEMAGNTLSLNTTLDVYVFSLVGHPFHLTRAIFSLSVLTQLPII